MDGLYLPLFAFVLFHCSLYLFDTIFKVPGADAASNLPNQAAESTSMLTITQAAAEEPASTRQPTIPPQTCKGDDSPYLIIESPNHPAGWTCQAKQTQNGILTPRRALSSFFWFSLDERPKVTAKKHFYYEADVARELGRRWIKADQGVKETYDAMAEKDRARYEREVIEYEKCLSIIHENEKYSIWNRFTDFLQYFTSFF